MTTLRHRRVLSAHRRLGPQCPPDVIAGRAQRHALGWRQINEPAPWPMWARATVAVALFAGAWIAVFVFVAAAVRLVDWMWGIA